MEDSEEGQVASHPFRHELLIVICEENIILILACLPGFQAEDLTDEIMAQRHLALEQSEKMRWGSWGKRKCCRRPNRWRDTQTYTNTHSASLNSLWTTNVRLGRIYSEASELSGPVCHTSCVHQNGLTKRCFWQLYYIPISEWRKVECWVMSLWSFMGCVCFFSPDLAAGCQAVGAGCAHQERRALWNCLVVLSWILMNSKARRSGW